MLVALRTPRVVSFLFFFKGILSVSEDTLCHFFHLVRVPFFWELGERSAEILGMAPAWLSLSPHGTLFVGGLVGLLV